MTAVSFPVAANAQQALSAPLGRAARQAEARRLAAAEVVFVSEAVGPAFASREAALDAFAGRIDDERPGRLVSIPPEDGFLVLREVITGPAPRRRSPQLKPAYKDGRRWPPPTPGPETVWRLSISYWRIGGALGAANAGMASPQREDAADARALRRRLEEPLQATKPQKALDIGLFEVRPPDAPHIVMPDE
jgi:hypothetical protein